MVFDTKLSKFTIPRKPFIAANQFLNRSKQAMGSRGRRLTKAENFPRADSTAESRQGSPTSFNSAISPWRGAMNQSGVSNNDWSDVSRSNDNNNRSIWSNSNQSARNTFVPDDDIRQSFFSSSNHSSHMQHNNQQTNLITGGNLDNSYNYNIHTRHNEINDDLQTSMNRFHISNDPHRHSVFSGVGLATITSPTSTSSGIPSIIGASSGSTATMRVHDRHSHSQSSTTSSLFQPGHAFHPQLQQPFQSNLELHQNDYAANAPQSRHHFSDIPLHDEGSETSKDTRSSKKKPGRWNKKSHGRPNKNQTIHRGKKGQQNPRHGQKTYTSPAATNVATDDEFTAASSKASSEAIRLLMKAPPSSSTNSRASSSQASALQAMRLPLNQVSDSPNSRSQTNPGRPILPSMDDAYPTLHHDGSDEEGDGGAWGGDDIDPTSPTSKKREWLLRMNRRMNETPVGELDPSTPVSAIMNAWAKTKSANGASMVEMWLTRAEEEANAGNIKVQPSTKMYTTAGNEIDAVLVSMKFEGAF